jgi:hypothetical protein
VHGNDEDGSRGASSLICIFRIKKQRSTGIMKEVDVVVFGTNAPMESCG